MKLKKGLSFFHASTPDQITFNILLSSRADEDGLIKVFRSHPKPTRHEAATSPLNTIALIVYDPNLMFDWTSEVVRDVISPSQYVETPTINEGGTDPFPHLSEAELILNED